MCFLPYVTKYTTTRDPVYQISDFRLHVKEHCQPQSEQHLLLPHFPPSASSASGTPPLLLLQKRHITPRPVSVRSDYGLKVPHSNLKSFSRNPSQPNKVANSSCMQASYNQPHLQRAFRGTKDLFIYPFSNSSNRHSRIQNDSRHLYKQNSERRWKKEGLLDENKAQIRTSVGQVTFTIIPFQRSRLLAIISGMRKRLAV